MKQQERESFVFKKRWLDAISVLDEASQLEIFKALAQFGLTGEMPEGASPICHALLISFSAEIQYNDAKYKASIENGKKGGRPTQSIAEKIETQDNPSVEIENPSPTQANPTDEIGENGKPNKTQCKPSVTQPKPNQTQDNPTLTQGNPDLTQQNPTETLNDYDYVNVNEYVNVFSSKSQSIKSPARTREVSPKSEELRNFWKSRFADFWVFGITPERDKLGVEVIDTLIEALEQSASMKRLKFNKATYCYSALANLFFRLKEEDFRDIVWSLQATEDIQSRPWYLLGALINKGSARESYAGIRLEQANFAKLLKEAEHGQEGP